VDDEVLRRLDDVARWFAARTEPVLLIDAGGVLFDNVIEDSEFIHDVADAFRVDEMQLLAAYNAADASFETNEVCVRDVLRDSVQRLGGARLDATDLRRIDELYAASLVPNHYMFALLQRARARGFTLVLTNNEAERWDRIKHAAFGFLDLFDHVASSWKLGVCKPTHAYFQRLDALLHPRRRGHWRLLDDNVEVIRQARAAGVPATRYRVRHAGAQA
jgi:putative hydrolase of the HAD superfamily